MQSSGRRRHADCCDADCVDAAEAVKTRSAAERQPSVVAAEAARPRTAVEAQASVTPSPGAKRPQAQHKHQEASRWERPACLRQPFADQIARLRNQQVVSQHGGGGGGHNMMQPAASINGWAASHPAGGSRKGSYWTLWKPCLRQEACNSQHVAPCLARHLQERGGPWTWWGLWGTNTAYQRLLSINFPVALTFCRASQQASGRRSASSCPVPPGSFRRRQMPYCSS